MTTTLSGDSSTTNIVCNEPEDSTSWHGQPYLRSATRIISQSGGETADSARLSTDSFYLASILRISAGFYHIAPLVVSKWIRTGQKDSWVEWSWQHTESQQHRLSWIGESIKTLRRFQSLPTNWDSYGAAPIDKETVERTIDVFLDIFNQSELRDRLPSPRVVPCPDGSIQMEWDVADCELEIVVSSSLSEPLEYLAVSPLETREGYLDQGAMIRALYWLIGQDNSIVF